MELKPETKNRMNSLLLNELGVSFEEAQKMDLEEFESLLEL